MIDVKQLTDKELDELLDEQYISFVLKKLDTKNKIYAMQMGLI